MNARYLITMVLLTSLLIPVPFAANRGQVVSPQTSGVAVDSMLRMDLVSESSLGMRSGVSGCKALLEFERPLSPSQVFAAESVGIHFTMMAGSVVHVGNVYSAVVSSLDSLSSLPAMGLLRATSGSKKFFPSLASSVAAIRAPTVWTGIERDGASITGTGMTVAVIDTGVNWLHPSFWRQSTAALNVLNFGGKFYVDLDGDNSSELEEGPIAHTGATPSEIRIADEYMYIDVNDNGVFNYADGDRWLGGIDANGDGIITLPGEQVVVLGESKVSMLFDQQNDLVYVRGVNLTSQALNVGDPNGHGTHVASIAAGGQIGVTSMVGVAPGADLIVIKSPLESSDILEAIYFAVANGAEVINMSFSSFLGFLDGTDLEDLAVSQAFLSNHTVSTLAAGNLGSTSKHARFQVNPASTSGASLSVFSPPLYSFVNILWRSDDSDEHIVLVPPVGNPIDLGAFSSIAGSSFSVSRPELNAYVFADTSIRGTNRLIVQISTASHNWTSGAWQVNLSNPSGDAIWVDAYAWDNSWQGSYLRFTSQVDSSRSISSPATADYGICVGSYDEGSHSISSSSGDGPRIDGTIKPEVVAPGVLIAAAYTTQDLWITRTGTSMAAPHVAGLIALIGQASGGKTGWAALTALLEGAGGYTGHHSPPIGDWGYGLCDSVLSVREVLGISLGPGTATSDWVGIEKLLTCPENLTLSGGLDILNVTAYQEVARISLAVTMRAQPNFTSDDLLMVQWDTDGNAGTGPSGADTVVNMTVGAAAVYNWNGSQYVVSSQTAQYWNDTRTAFITVQQTDPPLRGRLRVSTHNQSVAYADITPYADLANQWRPLVGNLTMNGTSTTYEIHMVISDRDDSDQSMSVGWSIVDGGLRVLKSGTVQGVTSVNVTTDLHNMSLSHVASTVFNISDGSVRLFLAPIMFSAGIATTLRFSSTRLDQSSIAVGPFVASRITGQLVLEGYLLATSVRVAFHSQLGFWLNFTLAGEQGLYPIDIVPAGFSAGQYDVYAAAAGPSGLKAEILFTQVLVFNDYSILVVAIVGVSVVIAVVLLLPRLLSRKHGVQG